MKFKIIRKMLFILTALLAIILIDISSLRVYSQEQTSSSNKLSPIESSVYVLHSTVKSVTTQEDLAKIVFKFMQDVEYNTGFPISEAFIPPFFENQPTFNDMLDTVEDKWSYFNVDDYYDETGLFLLWGNIVTGRFDKADSLFTKMKEKLQGRGIETFFEKDIELYFYNNFVIEQIYRINNFCKKVFSPREDLSLRYAAQMMMLMYEYQGKQDKLEGVVKLILDNYKDTKGADFLGIFYECREAELKDSSLKSISEEQREQIANKKNTAIEEMRKICEEGNK